MGNIGGPSRGCQVCRQRKVKCDEARPKCARCTNSSRICTGYRDNFDARFIHATGASGKRKYIRRQPIPACTASTSSPLTSKPTQSWIRSSRKQAIQLFKRKIAAANDGSLLEAAILLFESSYTSGSQPSSSLESCMDAFISAVNESAEDSSARQAMSAVSHGFYSFILRSREMQELADAEFTTAVSRAREALNDPQESKSDATLLTVFLLSMYENIDCVKELRPPVTTHYIGLVHLLRHRGADALTSGISQFLLRHFYERFASSVLGGELSIMTELLDTALLLPPPCNEQSSSFPVLHVVPIAQLRLRIEKMGLYTNFDVGEVEDILSTAQKIDKDLGKYPDKVPPSCHPKRSQSLLLVNANANANANAGGDGDNITKIYPDWADTYTSLTAARDWNYYRCLRITVNIFISRCAALLRKYTVAAAADQVCEQMVDEVCASVLFHTGALQRHFELFRNDPQFVPEDVDDRSYAAAAVGAMFLRPKLLWILEYASSLLRQRQVQWLQLQVSNISVFYRVHGKEG